MLEAAAVLQKVGWGLFGWTPLSQCWASQLGVGTYTMMQSLSPKEQTAQVVAAI